MDQLFWKSILLRVQFAAACVATYTYDFPAYNVPSSTDPPTTTPQPCPTGWIQFGSNCYIASTAQIFGADAEAACVNLGGTLVSIHSPAENAFVISLISAGTDTWIGAYRSCQTALTDTCFANWDNTPFDYSNWMPGEPNNQMMAGENCVFVDQATGQWNDYFCDAVDSYSYYVCEQPAA